MTVASCTDKNFIDFCGILLYNHSEREICMKQSIIDILKSGGGYVSGEKISQKLGISRAAVWKHIKSLRSEGYDIQSVTNKGYYLAAAPDTISEYEIKSGLKTARIGQNMRYVYETDSTNNEAKRFSDMADGTLFVAEIQTGGKGRLGRQWVSPAGEGIWMSLLLKPDIIPGEAPEITLIAGLAVCRALKDYGALIKWPNDVVIDGRKICGILTEMSAEIERVSYIICGIGINVNTEEFPDELKETAVSLYTVTGEKHSRAEIIKRVAEEFEPLYDEYLKYRLKNIIPEYKSACVNIGKRVSILYGEKETPGTAVDITENGHLVVDTDEGRVTISSGEVSVRGVYGYV